MDASLLVHIPPPVECVKLVVDPEQTTAVPLIAGGVASTVIAKVFLQPVGRL
jgi:hypothetical protein